MMDSDHAYRPVLLQVIPDEEGLLAPEGLHTIVAHNGLAVP